MRDLVREGYESGDYQGTYGRDRSLNSFELQFFGELGNTLRPGGKVLDLGCGTGLPYDRYLISMGYSVTGVDFSEKHISMAKQNVPEAEYVLNDMTSVNFPECSFDSVTMLYSLFHIPREEHSSLFRKIAIILKPGSLFLVTLGTHDSEYSEEPGWIGGTSMAWNSWSPEQYWKMLKDSGFSVLLRDFEGKPGDEEYHLWALLKRK